MGILSDVLKGMGLNSFQRALGAVLTLAVGLILIKYLMKLVGRALSRSRLEKAAHSMVLGILQVTLYLLLGSGGFRFGHRGHRRGCRASV